LAKAKGQTIINKTLHIHVKQSEPQIIVGVILGDPEGKVVPAPI